MRKVTALKAQARNKNRVNVYLDGEFAFGLAKIEAARLRVGQLITEADIARLQQADAVETLYESSLKYLSYRPRSEAEIRQHLRKKKEGKKKKEGEEEREKGVGEAQIEIVIERLRRAGLASDASFAEYWVENRSTFRPKGKRALKAELRAKGLPEAAMEAALAATDDEAVAAQLAASRARRLVREHLSEREFKRKLGDYLARRGLEYHIISEAVERAWRDYGDGATNFEESED